MINKTKIDWADFSWGPVIGCSKTPPCPYCYAHRMNKRFHFVNDNFDPTWIDKNFNKSFPKKPARIFVNSMSDIAYWEPEWMEKVLNKIKEYPQHIFLFLTKSPEIYIDDIITDYYFPGNCMTGFTATNQTEFNIGNEIFSNLDPQKMNFVSIEPIKGKIKIDYFYGNWIIIGAETGNRKDKIIPKRGWIEPFTKLDIPVFMKNNLKPIMGNNLKQEFPK